MYLFVIYAGDDELAGFVSLNLMEGDLLYLYNIYILRRYRGGVMKELMSVIRKKLTLGFKNILTLIRKDAATQIKLALNSGWVLTGKNLDGKVLYESAGEKAEEGEMDNLFNHTATAQGYHKVAEDLLKEQIGKLKIEKSALTKKGGLMENLQSTVVKTKKGDVEYVKSGDGFPVLVFHGGPGGYDQSVGLTDFLLTQGFSTICLSRPGYLRTPLSSGKTIKEQSELGCALLDFLNIDKAAVIGASAGGPPAYEFAINFPERTKAIVVIDGVSMKYSMPRQADAVQQMMFLSKTGEWLLNKMMEYFPKLVIEDILKTSGYLNSKELHERVEKVAGDPQKLKYAKIFLSSMDQFDKRKAGVDNDMLQLGAIDKLDVGKIKSPSLIIHGTADADVQFSNADYAASTIPGAGHFWINRGTHLCYWLSDQAKEAQKLTVDFLKKHCV